MEINSLNKQKHGFLIHTWSDKVASIFNTEKTLKCCHTLVFLLSDPNLRFFCGPYMYHGALILTVSFKNNRQNSICLLNEILKPYALDESGVDCLHFLRWHDELILGLSNIYSEARSLNTFKMFSRKIRLVSIRWISIRFDFDSSICCLDLCNLLQHSLHLDYSYKRHLHLYNIPV